ncbi:hypothetical protein Fot_21020 [Forsythia ovata]|uniref:Uncharacterized protein n=1 Tax=Forsythia ovata TaxID=205694 RepID=A0ABD1UTP1_9LAMI
MRLDEWAQADRAFLKSRIEYLNSGSEESPDRLSYAIFNKNYAMRQKYLRSYKFSRDENIIQKTKRCLKKKKNSKVRSTKSSCSVFRSMFKLLRTCALMKSCNNND